MDIDDAPTCQTCIHWVPWTLIDERDAAAAVKDVPSPSYGPERDKVPDDDPQVWGTCGLIVHPKTADRVRDVPAFTMDSSDYWGRLNCREDFGCNLHDPKPIEAVAPEYPGGTTTTEGQPRAVPKFEATPDPSEPAGALATPPPPGSPGGPPADEETVAIMTAASPDPIAIRKVRPVPRIKDPNQKTRPRLPDGLGQLGAVEGDR